MSLECLCVKNVGGVGRAAGGILRAKISCSPANVKVNMRGVGSIAPAASRTRNASSKLIATGHISPRNTSVYGVKQKLTGVFELNPGLSLTLNPLPHLRAVGNFTSSYTDKFAGSFNDFGCYQKLYPIEDVIVGSDGSYFVDRVNSSGTLYDNIDEGIFTGSYHTQHGVSRRITDDIGTFIQPSAIYTEGTFRYKCEVTNPRVTGKDSRLYFRVSAPTTNYSSYIAPEYKIYDIKLEDPSGNLIIQYNDITMRGDANYGDPSDPTYINFSTYGTDPKINNWNLYTWEADYPVMQTGSGYTLDFYIDITCLDDPFDPGFDVGYEDTCEELYVSDAGNDDYLAVDGAPLSTQTQSLSLNPTNTIRISAIEVCNSGGFDTVYDRYVPMYVDVEPTGQRIERCLLPTAMPLYEFDAGVYPAVSSIWSDQTDLFTNQSGVGASILTSQLRNDLSWSYITMDETGPVPDSGKLFVKFGHETPGMVWALRNGAFSFGIPGSREPTTIGDFDTATKTAYTPADHFFVIDSLSLKVKAKKAVGSRDYALDVVGWSDDKLLNVTPAVGGFLQNTSGDGDQFVPEASGYGTTNYQALAGEPVSDQDQYYESSGTNNAGGDHYLLSSIPMVTGTLFDWYEIPLEIYEDTVELGESTDYSVSSYFENLYMDIFPLPSGATISSLQLCISYKPANAFNLYTVGGANIERIKKTRGEGKLFPAPKQDVVLKPYLHSLEYPQRGSPCGIQANSGPNFSPLSKIENIPHAYTSPTDAKSNYARRWRGMEGTVQGPFDPDMFGFGFENPLLDFPFVSGYYDFSYDNGLTIISRPLGDGFGTLTGTLSTTYTEHHFNNLAWRFNSSGLFDDQLPGFTSDYRTTDWTALSNGAQNFEDHEFYGQIADAFSNAVRISGQNSYINFGDVDITDQFSMYIRFTPDANVSGVDYNLFDSGVLFSKWDSGSDLEFALGYSEGYLCAFAEASDGTLMTAKDTLAYSGYQYPLSVVMTHHNSSGLRLYTDNELHVDGYGDTVLAPFDTFRASSIPFTLRTGSSDLLVGNSPGSGVGMNMFVSEFGISNAANLVDASGSRERTTSPDLTFKEVAASKFLENNRAKYWQRADENIDRYKLWSYVDEDTQDWDLGAFKYCEFSVAFDLFTTRVGRDLISFNMNHDGSGYIQRNDLELPSSINYENIAYHTQIENDFLRLNLSDATQNFHSATPRITKDLPRGYKFSDRALVVETVLEHDTYNEIDWPDGNKGPKLIVSLYTQTKDPYWDSEQPNWGLVNRDIHYLEASGCWRRIDSTFDYDSMFDESEPWALFPTGDKRFTEFNHKYYSQDINDMFLQYDLVYPSGPPFESRINIHSAHVRLEDAFVVKTSTSGELYLTVSGEKTDRENLNLHTAANCTITNLDSGHQYCSGIRRWDIALGEYPSGLPLHLLPRTSGMVELDGSHPHLSGLPLFVSGSPYKSEQLNLHTATWSGIDSSYNPPGMSLYTSGNYRVEGTLPLAMENDQDWGPIPSSMSLNIHASDGPGNFAYLPTFLYNGTQSSSKGTLDNLTPSGLALLTLGRNALASSYVYGALNLTLTSPNIVSTDLNLVVWVDTSFITDLGANASLNLHTANYSTAAGAGSPYVNWTNTNYGTAIDSDDNTYASVSADNEIRGIDLICFGSCDVDGNVKCNEKALDTHCTTWRPETCTDGGIFRAIKTYTNLTADGFGDTVGFSGNYYGIRKYTGLMPSMAYDVTVQGQTGSTESINLPREWEEWEYGICGPDVEGCCDDDCDQNLVFSGVKMVGDYPYFGGDKSLSVPSGRAENDQFGRDVAVKGNLMVVGSPYHQLDEIGGNTWLAEGTTNNAHLEWNGGSGLHNAGALFVYRRRDPLDGGYKAPWDFEEKVVLPSAFRADYFMEGPGTISLGGFPAIPIRKWHIGQEGRELGWSVDAAIDEGKTSLYDSQKEVIVAGAPSAYWNRKFDNIRTSGVKVGVLVFSDEFTYDDDNGRTLQGVVDEHNMIYRYYSSPVNPEDPDNPVVVELDLKLIICQPTGVFGNSFDEFGTADFIYHKKIGRRYGPPASEIVAQIKSVFHEAFPYNDTEIHSGIPPIIGIYVDDSRSLGRRDLEPAIDMFKDYYSQYSLLSGVRDFYGTVSTGHMYEHMGDGPAENWLEMSKIIINTLLDTGRLVEDDGLRFITSGIGLEYANAELNEFNIPPASGGRVYVFEKESGEWNLIQEIKSPNENPLSFGDAYVQPGVTYTYYEPHRKHDRFGHAVAISDNTEVITVGSPYIGSDACQIYEHDPSEKIRLYSNVGGWLDHKNADGRYDGAIVRFGEYARQDGPLVAGERVYTELSSSEKFDLRSDETFWGVSIISEYKKIYTYSYNDIQTLGTWQFIPSLFAPTSRLGYSTTVNEDGTMVAFGAPTDSFNLFEDSNVYYHEGNTWSSYVNAGAVRMFESREYHPHSGVVEFYKFGNLGRSSDPDNPTYYEQLGHTFLVDGMIPFNITPFSDLEIPKEAGTAFIISPEIDAASDEIIENIKDWMALGDRNLVLVGNDPVWEDDGRYEKSNEIINKILEGLGSRMRLHPARNQYESLPECAEKSPARPNIVSSFRPMGSRETDIVTPTMYGKGVADIRMHVPSYETEQSPCDRYQRRCEMWLRDGGDLRAEWFKCCCAKGGKHCEPQPVNWPVRFGSHSTFCEDADYIKRPGEEPLPLLVAAEWISGYTVQSPDESGQQRVSLYAPKTRWIPPNDPFTRYDFADEHVDNLEFIWSSESGKYGSLTYADSPSVSDVQFFDPDPFEDMDADGNAVVRDGVLQAGPSQLMGIHSHLEPVQVGNAVHPDRPRCDCVLAAEEEWPSKSSSRVVMIGAVTPECEGALTADHDYNVSFYENLVRASCTEKGRIYQLGGWTNRTKFTDAYEGSLLERLFFFKGNTVRENFDTSLENMSNSYNVCWIAAPAGRPTDDDIAPLKDWMNRGNKTLVITYLNRIASGGSFTPPDEAIARNVEVLCDKLGINMKPLYLTGRQRYAHRDWDSRPPRNYGPRLALSNTDTIITGCNDNEKVVKFTMEDPHGLYDPDGDSNVSHFIPIDLGGVANEVVWTCYEGIVVDQCVCEDIYDERLVSYEEPDPKTSYWQMKSNIAKLSIPVIPYSGYRVFFDWVSETPDEDADVPGLQVWMKNAKNCAGPVGSRGCPITQTRESKEIPSTSSVGGWVIEDYIWATEDGESDQRFEHARAHLKVQPLRRNALQNNAQWGYVDIQAVDFESSLSEVGSGVDIYFSAVSSSGQILELQPEANYSVRLLSVSGTFLPIKETVHISEGQYVCDPNLEIEDATCVDGIDNIGSLGHCDDCYVDSIPSGEFIIRPGNESVFPERIRPIKTDNTKYCSCDPDKPLGPCGDSKCSCQTVTGPDCGSEYGCESLGSKLIDDGPVVVAEEYEHFSTFSAGYGRSKIILISDSNIVQGDCPFYRYQVVDDEASTNREFIRSLYPTVFQNQSGGTTVLPDGTVLQNGGGGRQFEFTQKLLAPERGSPQKYFAASGLSNLVSNFNRGETFTPASTPCDLMVHTASDSGYDPRDVDRPDDPDPDDIKKEIKKFNDFVIPAAGGVSKFSGVIEGGLYGDTSIGGAMPQIMLDKGSDYLEFDRFPSGYPGDLFGFSISMHSGQLMVGAPFNGFTGEEVVHWKDDAACLGSGLKLSGNGGAGAVYYFERTGLGSGLFGNYIPWEFLEKIKPSSANVGYDSTNVVTSQLEENLGTNNYTSSDLSNDGFVADMFGYDVSVQCDFVAIGAPGHNFENYHEHIYDRVEDGVPHSGAFLRKSFDFQFDIPLHTVYNLGGSGTRDALSGSGTSVLNNGAVFTYQHKIDDWQERTKRWSFAEKIVPQGYNSRKQKEYSVDFTPLPISGAENDHFGKSVDINRARRTDGDYTLAVGAPHHLFAASGNHDSEQPLLQAGASYVYDAMLRGQPPALGSPDNWIMVDVYGQLDKNDGVRLEIQQNDDGSPITYQQTGQIVSNNDGEIFLEASGYDPAIRGFTQHRSYIQLVYGDVVHGTPDSDYFNLHTSGRVPVASAVMNLHTLAPDSAYVYNSMDLYAPAVLGIASGVPSGLYLYLDCPSGVPISGALPSGLWLYTSGSSIPSEQINLSMRGK